MDVFLEILRLFVGEITLDEIVDLTCATRMLLVRGDHLRILAQRLTLGHFKQGGVIGIALVAIFAVEATYLLAIHLVRLFAPPHAPVVHIALGQALRPSPAFRRRAGPIRTGAVIGIHHQRQDLLEESIVTQLDGTVVLFRPPQRLLPAPVVITFGDLVAAAPQRQRRMRSQPLHLFQGLYLGIFQESLIVRIHGARIHEVLPNQDAQRVTDVEEIVRRINASTPNAKHVEMGFLGHLEQVQGMFGVDPSLDHLFGNVIGTFGKHRHAVHLKVKRTPRLVRFLNHLDGLDARADVLRIQQLAIGLQANLKAIQVLFTHLIGPPQLGVVDGEAEHLVLVAFYRRSKKALHPFAFREKLDLHGSIRPAHHVKMQCQLGLIISDLVGDDIGVLHPGFRPADELDGLP